MAVNEEEFPEDFIFDITNIPGSSEDVTLLAIEYYKKQLENPNLSEELKEVAYAYVINLTEYYELSNFNSPKLRAALPHLSKSADFMESKTCIDMDVEATGRIKSFYSVYQKILDESIEAISNNEDISEKCFFYDIYATRDILHPRHDMKFSPQAFYKMVYKTILEYMEYIDDLHFKDSSYSFFEIPETEKRNLTRPRKHTYPANSVDIPDKDFVSYALEIKGVPYAYRYLTDFSDKLSPEVLANEIIALKTADLSNPATYSNSFLFTMLSSQVKKEYSYTLRNHFEKVLIEKLSKEELDDYYSFPIDEFLENHEQDLNQFQINCCIFIKHMDSSEAQGLFNTETIPKFTNLAFMNECIETLNRYKSLQNNDILQRLESIKNLEISPDLEDFKQNLSKACRIRYYDICSKDYMKYPKPNGYQSFHIRINTPFGEYEKQIRTAKQHHFAENGPASHSLNYKPNIRTTFHRLKVPAPLSPKRDSNGDLIRPTELGILPFDAAVRLYYGTTFSSYSGGKTFEEFKSQFSSKEEFDKALLALSPKETSFLSRLKDKFSKKEKSNPIQTKISTVLMPEIPKDLAVYQQRPKGGTSTDDSDPHDNR